MARLTHKQLIHHSMVGKLETCIDGVVTLVQGYDNEVDLESDYTTREEMATKGMITVETVTSAVNVKKSSRIRIQIINGINTMSEPRSEPKNP